MNFFSELKDTDPSMALRLILESNLPSSFPSPGYPKKFNLNYFESAHDGLLQQLQAKFLDVNLFHVLEKDFSHDSYLFALVNTLNNSQESSTNFSLLVFLVGFAPLLGQILQLVCDKLLKKCLFRSPIHPKCLKTYSKAQLHQLSYFHNTQNLVRNNSTSFHLKHHSSNNNRLIHPNTLQQQQQLKLIIFKNPITQIEHTS